MTGHQIHEEAEPLTLLLVGAQAAWQRICGCGVLGAKLLAEPDEAFQLLETTKHPAILVDWQLPSGARSFCRAVRNTSADVRLVAIVPAASVGERLEAFAAGVDDCVDYDIDARELSARLMTILRRTAPITESDVMSLPQRVEHLGARHKLTHRECEALTLLVGGAHQKELSDQMGCSYATVRTHLSRLCRKLGCAGTREVILKVFRDSI